MTDEEKAEAFHTELYYCLLSLGRLASTPAEQCRILGNFFVGYEIQDDFLTFSGHLLDFCDVDFTIDDEVRIRIQDLQDAVRSLPKDAIIAPGLNSKSHVGSFAAVEHAAWIPIRVSARALLKAMELLIKNNRAYFPNSHLTLPGVDTDC